MDEHRMAESEVDTALPTRRRRWPWLLGGLVLAAGAVAAVLWLLANGDGGGEPAPAELSYAEAVRTDLTETEVYEGTLGRPEGEPVLTRRPGTITATAAEGATVSQGEVLFTVDNEPALLLYGDTPAYRTLGPEPDGETVLAGRSGTVTAAVDVDDVLGQGEQLYAVDEQPVVLLYGGLPAYRNLREGVEGADVEQLETALVALGYDPDGDVTVDEDFTSLTEAMVERWQEDVGAEDDGVVDLGEVVFLPGPVTVEDVAADEGDLVGVGTPVLAVSFVVDDLEGNDVTQLETALDALGYATGPVDGRFDEETAAAVVAWQGDAGMEADGRLDLGEVLFLPGPIRVTEVLVQPGSPVGDGTPVLATSAADTFVTVDLPAADQGNMSEGDAVTIELPDGTTTTGTVETVGTVASTDPTGESTFEVRIVLDDPAAAAGLDEAPVDVEVVTDSRNDVIAVPVTSLLALAEGGYAVEVADGDGTRLVAVEPGFYASGLVEIISGDIAPGDRVVVP